MDLFTGLGSVDPDTLTSRSMHMYIPSIPGADVENDSLGVRIP